MFLPDEKEVSSMCCVFVVCSKPLLFPNEIQSIVDSNIVDRHPQMFVVDSSPMVKKMLQGPCFFLQVAHCNPKATGTSDGAFLGFLLVGRGSLGKGWGWLGEAGKSKDLSCKKQAVILIWASSKMGIQDLNIYKSIDVRIYLCLFVSICTGKYTFCPVLIWAVMCVLLCCAWIFRRYIHLAHWSIPI